MVSLDPDSVPMADGQNPATHDIFIHIYIAGVIEIFHEMLPHRHKMHIILHRMHIARHRIIIFDKESIGVAFGRAPQGRGASLWMLSV